jgi:hypothetical protein
VTVNSYDVFLLIASQPIINIAQNWVPWSVVVLEHVPHFLLDAASKPAAGGLKLAMGITDTDALKAAISTSVDKLKGPWQGKAGLGPVKREMIVAIDSH